MSDTYKTYTAQYFRDNMREVLNQALTEIVVITRYDDEFMLTSNKALGRNFEIKPSKATKKPEKPVQKPENSPEEFVKEEWHEMELGKTYDVCKHNQIKGFCKKGCK